MRTRVAIAGLAFLLACNGGAGGNSTGGRCPLPATISAQNFVDALVTAEVCAAGFCAPIADGVLAQARASPEASQLTAAYAASIRNGTLAVDYARAPTCLAALSNGCRSDYGRMPPECDGVLIPKQAAGATCYTTTDCITGQCDGAQMAGCAGTCTDVSSCGEIQDCGVWQTCSNGVCGPGAAAGLACARDQDCAAGLVCIGSACATPGANGAVCKGDNQCAIGLFCNPDPGGASSGKCVPTVPVGHLCPGTTFPTFLGGFACGYGAYCNGTCVAYGAASDPCPLQQGDVVVLTCQAGLSCTNGVCEMPPATGPCNQGPCALQSYCDGTQNCSAWLADGQPCDQNAEYSGCLSGSCSDAGMCVAAGSVCPGI